MTTWLNKPKPKYLIYFLVFIGVLLAFIARVFNLTKSSIWHDEGFSVMLALRNTQQIWQGSARDVHPPFYYEILHFWITLFGNSVFAIRFLSVIAGVLAVILTFIVVNKISTRRAAILSLFLAAFAPILVRYSQEARMYGLFSSIMLSALLSVIYIVKKPKSNWPYVFYAVFITAGLYTHYFTVLAVASFWLYFILLDNPRSWRFGKTTFLSLRWWLSNLAALILFLPWLGNFISQITRGQGLGWLSKTNIYSFTSSLWQFFSFTDGRQLSPLLYWLVALVVVGAVVYLVLSDKSKQKYNLLIVIYSLLPIVLALLVSIYKPVFHERYFVFSAVGIFIILAITIDKITNKKLWLFYLLSIAVLAVEFIGVRNVYSQSNHQMQKTINTLNNNFMQGDTIIAGELYVYFDGTFYNASGQKILLYTKNSNPNGYGESGLLYDQNVYLDSYTKVPAGSRVWLIGKTGNQEYYSQVPSSWQLLRQLQAGYSELRLYRVE